MRAVCSSPFGEDRMYSSIKDCLPPPPLPPPNQEVRDCKIDCPEKNGNTPPDAVDSHCTKSLTVDIGVTTAVVENGKSDYEAPIPREETKEGLTAVSELIRN